MFTKKFFISSLSCLVLALVILLAKPNKIVLGVTCTEGTTHIIAGCTVTVGYDCVVSSWTPVTYDCWDVDGVCKGFVLNEICGYNAQGNCEIIFGNPQWVLIPCSGGGPTPTPTSPPAGPTNTPVPTNTPIPTATPTPIRGRIQGRRVDEYRSVEAATTVTVNGIGNYDLPAHWSSYSTGDILPWGNSYTVSSNVPTGFEVLYSVCSNCTSHDSYTPGSTVNVTIPTPPPDYYTGYVDLYWKYRGLPSQPTGVCGSFNQDPNNPYTPVTWTWTAGTGLQVTRDYAPETIPASQYWMYNAAASSGIIITPPAGKYMPPGHTIYARTTYNWSTFSTTSSVTCPVPPNPDPATIQGNLQQKSGTGCYTAIAPDHTFNISSISSTTSNGCVTSVCKADPGNTLPNPAATGYNCAITFDNAACLDQSPPTWPTSATVNLTGATTTNPGFSFIGWTDPQDPPSPPGTCQTAPTNSVLVAAGSSTTKNLTFNFSGDNWLKTKDTSFYPSFTTGTTAVSIPMWANPFPASNDTGSPYFIIGQAGSALGISVSPDTAYSTPHNWYHSGYSHAAPVMNAVNFISYIKSRKSYQPISDLVNINADGIYVWTGGVLTISDLTKFNPYNVVLISNGEIKIDKEPFSSNKSLAIIANTITFTNSVHKATGIFIANTINTGNPANQGLQIVGNLIALYTFNNERSWSDTSIPSIFVEFDPSQYINLLPYLSTASYDWRQLQ